MGIDDDIARINTQIANLERQAELLRAEVRGMLLARKYYEDQPGQRPQPARLVPAEKVGKRGGRQPGAISNRWKDILFQLFQLDAWFDESAVIETVFELENRRIKPAEVRRIFEGYAEHGYVEIGDRGLYRITDEAVSKYGFHRAPALPPIPPLPSLLPDAPYDVFGELTKVMEGKK